MLQNEAPDIRKRRRGLLLLFWLAGLLLFVCLAAAGAWTIAARTTAQALDRMLADAQTHGQVLSCPGRQISGFPFAFEVSCDGPSFAGLISGKPMTVRLKALRATLHFFHPLEVLVAAEAPLALHSEDGQTDLSVAWSSLELVAGGLPEGISQISFRGQNLATHGVIEGLGSQMMQSTDIDGVVAKSRGRQDESYDFRVAAQNPASPWLTAILGEPPLSEIKTDGTVTQVSFDPAQRPAESLEHWRLKGGRIDVGNLAVSQGETHVSAHGVLALDAAHRPQGKLDTESVGIEPVLRRYGINPSLATAGMLLSSLFGGASHNKEPPPGSPAALRLPLRLDGGAVIIGPVQTAIRLPPLY
jgi:hypothetical protein